MLCPAIVGNHGSDQEVIQVPRRATTCESFRCRESEGFKIPNAGKGGTEHNSLFRFLSEAGNRY